MNAIEQKCYFYTYEVPNHSEVKNKILEAIASEGVFSLEVSDQKIFNSDWHLHANHNRPYVQHFYPVIEKHVQKLTETVGMPPNINLSLRNFWFQQYKEGDCHGWHIHGSAVFSNVYYVDLPDGAAKTSFKVDGKEFEIEVSEGQILTFPSCFLHCSKPNPTGVKTVISFNY